MRLVQSLASFLRNYDDEEMWAVPTNAKIDQAAAAVIALYQTLSHDNLDQLRVLARGDMHFTDSFNSVDGIERVVAAFRRMLNELDDLRWEILGSAVTGNACYLRWKFHCRPKKTGKMMVVDGMSELTFDEAGLLASHVDYWDAGRNLYEKIPVLGWIIAKIRRSLGENDNR